MNALPYYDKTATAAVIVIVIAIVTVIVIVIVISTLQGWRLKILD
jgi:hypothetical protein